jgi:transcriptional regulator with PAS, ATPase and Fis domain
LKHNPLSRRKDKPFIAVNCAAIPENLFESELFGHKRGAFTGAERTYIGKFERCHTGTLFLDEIGEISLPMQAKLLRALQTGEIERLGGSQVINVDVRIIAATNKDLEAAVKNNLFREDLYWRLKVISLDLPPLRQRKEDIPQLVKYFLSGFAFEYDRQGCYVSEAALRKLSRYFWPGNVRELENCVQEIMPEIFQHWHQDIYPRIMETVEEVLIRNVLEQCGNSQVKAAAMLGMSRNTLRQKLKKQQEKQS